MKFSTLKFVSFVSTGLLTSSIVFAVTFQGRIWDKKAFKNNDKFVVLSNLSQRPQNGRIVSMTMKFPDSLANNFPITIDSTELMIKGNPGDSFKATSNSSTSRDERDYNNSAIVSTSKTKILRFSTTGISSICTSSMVYPGNYYAYGTINIEYNTGSDQNPNWVDCSTEYSDEAGDEPYCWIQATYISDNNQGTNNCTMAQPDFDFAYKYGPWSTISSDGFPNPITWMLRTGPISTGRYDVCAAPALLTGMFDETEFLLKATSFNISDHGICDHFSPGT